MVVSAQSNCGSAIVPTKVIDDAVAGAQIAANNGRNEATASQEPRQPAPEKLRGSLYITGRHSTHRRCKGFHAHEAVLGARETAHAGLDF